MASRICEITFNAKDCTWRSFIIQNAAAFSLIVNCTLLIVNCMTLIVSFAEDYELAGDVVEDDDKDGDDNFGNPAAAAYVL